MPEKLLYVLVIVVVVLGWGGIAYLAHDCKKAGGALVQGVLTFECVKQLKD